MNPKPLLDELKELMAQVSSGDDAIRSVMDFLHKRFDDYHWVGVYRLEGDTLVLGPYAGPATNHVRIPVGRGVCGTAVAEGRNQIIDDVSSIGNYLACNLETKSEIVVLIKDPKTSKILGQIDVDGTRVAAFGKSEEAFLERVAELIAPHIKRLGSPS